MKVANNLRVALPCIVIFGTIGGFIGSALGDTQNGIRAGIITGGGVAFFIIQRRESRVG